jgi:hypothetical protein
MKRSFIALGVFLFILTSCGPEVKILTPNSKCQTTVEGFYHVRVYMKWSEEAPTLFWKSKGQLHGVSGKILEINDEGVLFDPRREGPFYDPKPKFFPKDQIVTLIDSARHVILGEIPEKYTDGWQMVLWVKNVSLKNTEVIPLKLLPNSPFGFCMVPGLYHIERIQFKNKVGIIDEGLEIPNLFFKVERNKANYIGDLYLDPKEFDQSVIGISYKNVYSPKEAFWAGAIGGLWGSALYHAYKAAKGADGVHFLMIKKNENFKSILKRPLTVNLLGFRQQ